MLLHCGYICGGGVRKVTMPLVQLSASFQLLPPNTHKQIRPFWCWFLGGWVCVHSRTLWVSPVNSPVKLGVSPTTTTGFYSQRFWGFLFLCWNPGLRGQSHSLVVPPSLFACKCATTCSFSCCLVLHPIFNTERCCPYPPLLPVWMNVSSLTPWLSDFHTVQFSGSSGYFLFLNLLLSFFWLCGEAKCIYLCLHLHQTSLNQSTILEAFYWLTDKQFYWVLESGTPIPQPVALQLDISELTV